MSRSHGLAQRQMMMILVAAGALSLAAWFTLRPRGRAPLFDAWYFYDTGSKRLFSAPATTPSPTKGESGGEAVRAFIYSCTGCGESSALTISFLEKTTDEAVAAQQKLAGTVSSNQVDLLRRAISAGRLVRREKDSAWVSAESAEGQAIQLNATRACPDGEMPAICTP